ncbi:hypothetical protein P3S67_028056 [Capsicum chacoense]
MMLCSVLVRKTVAHSERQIQDLNLIDSTLLYTHCTIKNMGSDTTLVEILVGFYICIRISCQEILVR